jgi:hypothetical protein
MSALLCVGLVNPEKNTNIREGGKEKKRTHSNRTKKTREIERERKEEKGKKYD